MTAVDVLAAGGILRPADVVAIAGRAGLELAAAAVLFMNESGVCGPDGRWTYGHNIWGSDSVPTGGAYRKGDQVTEQNYAAYKAALAAGTAKRNGCGPTQLTWSGYQSLADARGGCWRWAINCAVGFEILAGHIRDHGTRGGFRAYNGTGPAADQYAARAITRLAEWRAKLGQPHSTLAQGARGPEVRELQQLLGITADGIFGPATARAVRAFQAAHGLVADGICGPATWAKIQAIAA